MSLILPRFYDRIIKKIEHHKGPTGATGATGATGSNGSTGATGATGGSNWVDDYSSGATDAELFTVLPPLVNTGVLLGKGSVTPRVDITTIGLTVIGAPVTIIPQATTITTIAVEWKTTIDVVLDGPVTVFATILTAPPNSDTWSQTTVNLPIIPAGSLIALSTPPISNVFRFRSAPWTLIHS